MDRRARVVLTVLAAVALVASGGFSPVHATTGTTAVDWVETGPVDVTSSTGVPLQYALFMQPKDELEVIVSDDNGETHTWFAQTGFATFSYDPTSFTGRLHAKPADFAKMGTVDLTIASDGTPTTRDCHGGSTVTRQPVTLSGSFFFDTRSAAWGTIGDATNPIEITDAYVRMSPAGQSLAACQGNSKSVCAGAVGWGGYEGPQVPGLLSGFSYASRVGEVHNLITYDTNEPVHGVPGVNLSDDYAAQVAAPTIRTNAAGRRVMTVTSTPSTLITGTARLVSTGKPVLRHLCRGGRSKVWPARYVPGDDPLTVHPVIGATFTSLPGKKYAYIEKDPRS